MCRANSMADSLALIPLLACLGKRRSSRQVWAVICLKIIFCLSASLAQTQARFPPPSRTILSRSEMDFSTLKTPDLSLLLDPKLLDLYQSRPSWASYRAKPVLSPRSMPRREDIRHYIFRLCFQSIPQTSGFPSGLPADWRQMVRYGSSGGHGCIHRDCIKFFILWLRTFAARFGSDPDIMHAPYEPSPGPSLPPGRQAARRGTRVSRAQFFTSSTIGCLAFPGAGDRDGGDW